MKIYIYESWKAEEFLPHDTIFPACNDCWMKLAKHARLVVCHGHPSLHVLPGTYASVLQLFMQPYSKVKNNKERTKHQQ